MSIKTLLASTAIVLAFAGTAPLVSADDTTAGIGADIDNRRAEMNDSMEAWQARVDEHDAETDGVDDAVDSAWAEVQAAWADVEDATEESWEDASEAFDEAMEDLEEAWDDATDDDSST
jgi:hypothetical protein